MSTTQILIAGFGGQGVLFAGKFIANIGLIAEKQVSWLPSYGQEMRGGTANCGVIISDEPVGSPIVSHPDVLVAMNLPSLKRYENDVAPGGMIIVDSTLADEEIARDDVKVFRVPSTKKAKDAGFASLSNMILMGKLLKETDCFSLSLAEAAMKKVVPARKADLLGVNLKAVETGYNFE